MKIPITVTPDFLKRLSATSAVRALAELIWNALDADATEVAIEVDLGFADSIECIRVTDNGTGMTFTEAETAFGSLGGSWKKNQDRTRVRGRQMHGKEGMGRFRAFALGGQVEWRSLPKSSADEEKSTVTLITGTFAGMKDFELTLASQNVDDALGTTVTICDVSKKALSLLEEDIKHQILIILAPYLSSYPDIEIRFRGELLDIDLVSEGEAAYIPLSEIQLASGEVVGAELMVKCWTFNSARTICLCDPAGFTLHEVPGNIRAPGYNYTAYLKSDYLQHQDADGTLILAGTGSTVESLNQLLDIARQHLRAYFKDRIEEDNADVLERWKEDGLYPFSATEPSPVEVIERRTFDIVAISVNKYLTGFGSMDASAKRLILECLRVTLDSGQESARRIFGQVLQLPRERQRDLLTLIDKTSLVSMIEASKHVADRLEFLAGLRAIVLEPDLRKATKERSQLHRILVENTWVFGEEYNLAVDDQDLKEALNRHDEMRLKKPTKRNVIREDGRRGIIDLMLSARVPLPDRELREHLIVELKSPSVAVGMKAVDQLISYARALAKDPAFPDPDTTWKFIVVSTQVTDEVNDRRNEDQRPRSVVFKKDGITVWVRTWGEIINSCSARLELYREKLNYQPDQSIGLEFLEKYYSKYLPAAARRRLRDTDDPPFSSSTENADDSRPGVADGRDTNESE